MAPRLAPLQAQQEWPSFFPQQWSPWAAQAPAQGGIRYSWPSGSRKKHLEEAPASEDMHTTTQNEGSKKIQEAIFYIFEISKWKKKKEKHNSEIKLRFDPGKKNLVNF